MRARLRHVLGRGGITHPAILPNRAVVGPSTRSLAPTMEVVILAVRHPFQILPGPVVRPLWGGAVGSLAFAAVHISSVVRKVMCSLSSCLLAVGWDLTFFIFPFPPINSDLLVCVRRAFPFFWKSAHCVLARDVAKFTFGDKSPLLLEVAVTSLEFQSRFRSSMHSHIGIFQLATITEDLHLCLDGSRLAFWGAP